MTKLEHRDLDGAEQADPEVGTVEESGGSDLGGGDRSMDPETMTIQDVMDAESGRPDLPDENADGLDETEEAVRRNAEDLPLDKAGSD